MKKSINTWQFCGFAISSLLGSLLHFLYQWTNKSAWVAPFCAVNESTWEHMKLLFFSSFAFAILQSFYFKQYQNFWLSKLKGILLGLLLIPIIFYTYNGAIAPSPPWINVLIFFVAMAGEYISETCALQKIPQKKSAKLSVCALCLIGLSFVVFTFFTPKIGIFKDPINGSFGI